MESQMPLFFIHSEKKVTIADLVKVVSPGTTLRNAVEDIVRGGMGALIVFYNDKLLEIVEGGFKLNVKLNQQKLVELSKMDGAIIISNDRKKILYANSLLVPDKNILTNETGTRHKAAERTAKQAETMTIAVSERRSTVTIYYKDLKYVLKKTEELISRATESLQILEKQKELFDNLFSNLNVMEVLGLSNISDVAAVLKRIELIKKIADRIERYTVELGSEGVVIRMRLKELTFGLEDIEKDILMDYSNKSHVKVKSQLSELSFDELVDLNRIINIICPGEKEERKNPKGYRFLRKLELNNEQIAKIINVFYDLQNILNISENAIKGVLTEEESKKFIRNREKIKEKILS